MSKSKKRTSSPDQNADPDPDSGIEENADPDPYPRTPKMWIQCGSGSETLPSTSLYLNIL